MKVEEQPERSGSTRSEYVSKFVASRLVPLLVALAVGFVVIEVVVRLVPMSAHARVLAAFVAISALTIALFVIGAVAAARMSKEMPPPSQRS